MDVAGDMMGFFWRLQVGSRDACRSGARGSVRSEV